MTDVTSNDYLTRTKGGSVFVGSDVQIVAALSLASSLRLYAATKMLPMRGVTATRLLDLATGYTGKAYKRGGYEVAAADLTAWADEQKASPRTEGG